MTQPELRLLARYGRRHVKRPNWFQQTMVLDKTRGQVLLFLIAAVLILTLLYITT